MQLTVSVDLSAEKEEVLAKIDTFRKVIEAWFVGDAEAVTAAPEDPTDPVACLGTGAQAVYRSLLKAIELNKEATLTDVFNDTGMGMPTIRAHLMNAGRTFRSSRIPEPVVATWDPVRSCVVYTKR